MDFPAHFREQQSGQIEIQTVEEHCRNTAKIAEGKLSQIGLGKTGYLAGLTHDMGKMSLKFKKYILESRNGKVPKGSVIHAHAAAKFFLKRHHKVFCSYEDMTVELLAYATGAHHGLFDCVNSSHEIGFIRRLMWDKDCYQEVIREFTIQCASEEELEKLLSHAREELQPIYEQINKKDDGKDHNEEIFFQLGLLSRLLLSAVMEGDRYDTATFQYGKMPETSWNGKKGLWCMLLNRVEQKLNDLSGNTPIQKARMEISQICRDAAQKPQGIFRLNIPTGSGKTLSSLRFALAHAEYNANSRIIFTSPLLSILDQNAKILREFIGDDRLILEHHSNVIQSYSNDEDKMDSKELMVQNWDAPVIITTLVQLLDTLFKGKNSCIRRFQALCGCVLVIDEVQTVPIRMLSLFNMAMDFLAQVCKATIVFCSATQPCFEATEHPIRSNIEELVPYRKILWKPFDRTKIEVAKRRRLEEIPDYIQEIFKKNESVLVVCNKKKQAQFLYKSTQSIHARCFHISASMCQAHRKKVLEELELALKLSRQGGPKVLCISTQVIEAGVDVSFSAVIRFLAGMDNVIQSAGRCNRNAECSYPASVYLLECSDESLENLQEIQKAKEASRQLIELYQNDPTTFDHNLASNVAIECYYKFLYGGMSQGAQDYPVGRTSLFDLLACNDAYTIGQRESYGLNQAFKEAGKIFQVFDQETTDVLVPYGKGKELILKLDSAFASRNVERQKQLLKEITSYTVSLYQYQKEDLEANRGLTSYMDGAILALDSRFYDDDLGLMVETKKLDFWEV